jgi:hypothetical protein
MRAMNRARARIVPFIAQLLLGTLLASCAADWAPRPMPAQDQPQAGNPLNAVAAQTGRLTVVALDYFDGRPLNRAMVDIVGSSSSDETYHYRRTGFSNQFGMVTFTDVPKTVDVFIRHSRGLYGRDRYPVPQSGTSEFRVYIETTGPRQANE